MPFIPAPEDVVNCENARCDKEVPFKEATTWTDPGGVHIFCSVTCEEQDTDDAVYARYG